MQSLIKVSFIIAIFFLIGCQENPKQKTANMDLKVSSKKETQTADAIQIDHMVFGIYCAECSRNCATMYKYSRTNNSKSFAIDSKDNFFGKEMKFNKVKNDSAQIKIANEIIQVIPVAILQNPQSLTRYGCPDCTDGCGIYFELSKDKKVQKFYIDTDTSFLKGGIKNFAMILKNKIHLLKTIE